MMQTNMAFHDRLRDAKQESMRITSMLTTLQERGRFDRALMRAGVRPNPFTGSNIALRDAEKRLEELAAEIEDLTLALDYDAFSQVMTQLATFESRRSERLEIVAGFKNLDRYEEVTVLARKSNVSVKVLLPVADHADFDAYCVAKSMLDEIDASIPGGVTEARNQMFARYPALRHVC